MITCWRTRTCANSISGDGGCAVLRQPQPAAGRRRQPDHQNFSMGRLGGAGLERAMNCDTIVAAGEWSFPGAPLRIAERAINVPPHFAPRPLGGHITTEWSSRWRASRRQTLPILYKPSVPLQSGPHSAYRARTTDKAPFFAKTHAVPLTIDEFVHSQRHFPIVFTTGENSVPLGLSGSTKASMSMSRADGTLKREMYVPAYVRRYPYLLARLTPEAQELSLCFDPDSGLLSESGDGPALFENDRPSEATSAILKFCEEFELSAQRTAAFVKELLDMGLLMDGEVAIQITGQEQPYVYRGFQMVNEEKFRDLRGDELRKINQNGILPLIMAHLFSLALVRDVFGRQMADGLVPTADPALTLA
jgi:hypothetical protein